MKVAIVGSRQMSRYGQEMIGELMSEIGGKFEVVTVDVAGCNREVGRLGGKLIPIESGNFELVNEKLARLADQLIVIEGGERSGTRLVAEKFLDLGKPVWAVPGRVGEPGSWMTNWLIGQGAIPLFDLTDLARRLTEVV